MPALIFLLPVVLLVFMVRSQRRRLTAQRSLVDQLRPGDEVLTSGGLIGRVVTVSEREVSLEIAPGTIVRIAAAAVIGRPAGLPNAAEPDGLSSDRSEPTSPDRSEPTSPDRSEPTSSDRSEPTDPSGAPGSSGEERE
jgi:preprotein translocase subunit YajC